MNDTLPDADGSFHDKTVCVSDAETNDPCKDTFTIEVHNGGDFRVYVLESLQSGHYGLGNDSVSYCFDLSVPLDPCSDVISHILPALESRRPGNTIMTQSDDSLLGNWYSAGPYEIVRNSPDLELPVSCGAKAQIWMNDSFPEVDGKHHIRKLCITDVETSQKCVGSIHYTFIKNCGSHFVYFLTSSPKPDSAYCFDIPSESNDPAPDFTPSNVQIESSLKWNPHGLTSSTEWPSLHFQCSFDKSTEFDLFYVVYFYVDGSYIDTGSDIIVQDSSEAYVTEQLLNFRGFSAGITISCFVGGRTSRNGRTGVIAESPGFYAGIKMVNHSVDIQRGENGTVGFFTTIPFGCVYDLTYPEDVCYMTLSISSSASDNSCGSNSMLHPCTVQLKGVTKDELHQWRVMDARNES
ncbi:uncharacterized protein LOC117342010 [Pecten maximus]|uniref:uncharacterized protein LOC117342010 n=1 Tax=Pecten maximus TaxID=6579 RepID=UPI001459172A|nr:uncharacterized protein LOC117342010 [Pecten maximus]